MNTNDTPSKLDSKKQKNLQSLSPNEPRGIGIVHVYPSAGDLLYSSHIPWPPEDYGDLKFKRDIERLKKSCEVDYTRLFNESSDIQAVGYASRDFNKMTEQLVEKQREEQEIIDRIKGKLENFVEDYRDRLMSLEELSKKVDSEENDQVIFELKKAGQEIIILDLEENCDYTLSNSHYNKSADMLTKYGIARKPDQDFTVKEVEAFYQNKPLKGTPNILLGNAGFKGLIRTVFLNVSTESVKFNTQITEKFLDELEVSGFDLRSALEKNKKRKRSNKE